MSEQYPGKRVLKAEISYIIPVTMNILRKKYSMILLFKTMDQPDHVTKFL